MSTTRREHDLLGERGCSCSCYYGIQTLRAIENFDITGIPISHYPRFINSLASIKKAAALANYELGFLKKNLADPIVQACDEIIAGKFYSRLFCRCHSRRRRYIDQYECE